MAPILPLPPPLWTETMRTKKLYQEPKGQKENILSGIKLDYKCVSPPLCGRGFQLAGS